MPELEPISELIRRQTERIESLIGVINSQEREWVPIEAVFQGAQELADSTYTARAWQLFRADLQLLADLECVAVRDDYVLLAQSVSAPRQ